MFKHIKYIWAWSFESCVSIHEKKIVSMFQQLFCFPNLNS